MKNIRKNKKTYDQLISGSYGKSTKAKKGKSSFSISKSFDNGEVLAQKPKKNFLEYVVQSSIAVDTPFEEYIVHKKAASDISIQNSVDMTSLYSTQRYTAAQEAQMDINNPLQDHTANATLPNRFNDTNVPGNPASIIPAINNSGNKEQDPNCIPCNRNPSHSNSRGSMQLSMDESFKDHSKSATTDDDFVRDMQAILTGQKVFDPIHKKTVDKPQVAASQAQPENIQLPQVENKHAIFDQIAQSMEYAKAYDLGSIDLDKRFNDFDKVLDIEREIPEKKGPIKNVAVNNSKSDEPIVGNEEFIKDLDIISKAAKANKNGDASSAMSASDYSLAQNPAAVVAAIETADAIQIGLGAAAIVQAQVSSSQGSFSMSYDKAQRMLTSEARLHMPGAQTSKQSYSRRLFFIGGVRVGTAEASVIVEWEGNAYGEIGTAVMRRDLQNSTEWSKSSANLTIAKIDRIPTVRTDPRTWPLVYTYEGTYDPLGNGYYEFSGEFEINAFGGLKFNRHEVISRSLTDVTIMGQPTDFVQKGQNVIVPTPAIPQEQIDYLRTRLP